MNMGMGIALNFAHLKDVYKLEGSKVKVKDLTAYPDDSITIDYLPVPVTGSLVLGAVAGDLYMLEHLAPDFAVTMKENMVDIYDEEDVRKISAIYRYCGHQVEILDQISKQTHSPWAPVNEVVLEPASVHFDPKSRKRFTFVGSYKTSSWAVEMPQLVTMGPGEHIAISFQKPFIKPIEFRSARTELQMTIASLRPRRTYEIKVKGTYAHKKGTYRAVPRMSYGQPDFPETPAAKPPSRVEGLTIIDPPVQVACVKPAHEPPPLEIEPVAITTSGTVRVESVDPVLPEQGSSSETMRSGVPQESVLLQTGKTSKSSLFSRAKR